MKVELGIVRTIRTVPPSSSGYIPDGSHARIYCSAQSFRPYMTVPSSGFSQAEKETRQGGGERRNAI
jgi:hypothetical protein